MSNDSELPTRDNVPDDLKWSQEALYANEALWEQDFAKIQAAIPGLRVYQGRLCESAETLVAALRARDEVSLLLSKVGAWAGMRYNEDMKNAHYKGLSDRVDDLSTAFSEAVAYMRPEMLAAEPAKISEFVSINADLEVYARQFELLERARPHTRSTEVAGVIAAAGKVLGGPNAIYDALTMSLQFPKIEDKDGKLVKVEDDNLNSRWLRSRDAGERRRGFNAVMETYDGMRDVFAATYSAEVNANIFLARQHGYGSALEASLKPKNIPVDVYTSLIAGVHANIPALARYLSLRKKLMGRDELRLYDLYVPMVGDADVHYDWKQTQEMCIAAVAPLGEEYVEKFASGYRDRWYDVVQTKNKARGAWGGGGYYRSFPYSLLNHHGDLESAYTAIHEGGHCVHSLLSRESQTQQNFQYVIFVAEVASTLNETLLDHYLLKTATDPMVKLTVLNKSLEGVRQTIFRQVLFAEFEYEAHRLAEAGQPLTADVLSDIHRGLYQKYYGRVCTIDPIIGAEWMRIPHFYSAFYVYQYAIGIACARDLAGQLLTEGEPARRRIIDNFLRAGGSKDPIDILRAAGTDPSTPHPVSAALKSFESQLAQFEALLDEVKR